MDPLAVPAAAAAAAHNAFTKQQGPDSPVSVFDFERRSRSRSRSKTEYPGLYPPPRPPRKSSASPASALRRCQSQPPPPPPHKQGGSSSRREGHLQHQSSANVLAELSNAGSGILSYPRSLGFESACSASASSSPPGASPPSPPAAAAACSGRGGLSPLSGKENQDSQQRRSATGVWSDRTTKAAADAGTSEIEEIACEGSGEKKRTCPVLHNISPFSMWSNMQSQPRGLEHRKSQTKADDVEEVIVNINLQKVSKKDLQLNPRESRRLVLLFILFNLLFGGLLVFRTPRAGETGFLTPRITSPEQLLNLHGNIGAKWQFYRKLVGPRGSLVAVDPGAGSVASSQLRSQSGSASSNSEEGGELVTSSGGAHEATAAAGQQRAASGGGFALPSLSST